MKKSFLLALVLWVPSYIFPEVAKLWVDQENNLISTSHQMKIEGKALNYTAVLGSLPLRNAAAETLASIFFVAYFKEGENAASARPLTFVFNGGPGAASIWLHIGGIGPRTIQPLENPSDRYLTAMEYNSSTMLDETDLVFVDPVGTGFSRAYDEKKAKDFYSVEGDILAASEFVANFLSRFKRWDSPKYLLGESYGTLRCAGMAKHMHTELGIFLEGVILISPALNYEITLPFRDNSTFFVTNLPSYAVTAWYHQLISRKLYPKVSQLIQEVQEFAYTDYLKALFQGDALPETSQKVVIEKMNRYTGISRDRLEKDNLRISDIAFMDHFFSREKKTVGRMDTRTVGYYTEPESVMFDLDPSIAKPSGVIIPAFYAYLQNELGFDKDALLYKPIALDVNLNWDYSEYIMRYPNTSSSLRSAFFAHPNMKIFIGSGIYDLAVPFGGAEYVVNHLLLPKPLQQRTSLRYYNAGHMMYLDAKSRIKLKNDLVKFYQNAQGANDSYTILD